MKDMFANELRTGDKVISVTVSGYGGVPKLEVIRAKATGFTPEFAVLITRDNPQNEEKIIRRKPEKLIRCEWVDFEKEENL